MDKELIKQHLLLKLKPKARVVPKAKAQALLARYGQTYQPGAVSAPAPSEE